MKTNMKELKNIYYNFQIINFQEDKPCCCCWFKKRNKQRVKSKGRIINYTHLAVGLGLFFFLKKSGYNKLQ